MRDVVVAVKDCVGVLGPVRRTSKGEEGDSEGCCRGCKGLRRQGEDGDSDDTLLWSQDIERHSAGIFEAPVFLKLPSQMGLTGLRASSKKKDRAKSFEQKLDKKLGFFAKVKDAAASDPKKKDASVSLGAKKTISKKKRLRSRQKKLKAYDLSALSEFLPDLKPLKITNVKLNCKSRQKLVQKETAQLRAVLGDSSFQANPVAAIHQYLERTQPPLPLITQEKENREKHKGKKKKSKKKSGKGASSSCQSMEI